MSEDCVEVDVTGKFSLRLENKTLAGMLSKLDIKFILKVIGEDRVLRAIGCDRVSTWLGTPIRKFEPVVTDEALREAIIQIDYGVQLISKIKEEKAAVELMGVASGALHRALIRLNEEKKFKLIMENEEGREEESGDS